MNSCPRKSLEATFLSIDRPLNENRKVLIFGTGNTARIAYHELLEHLEGDDILGLTIQGDAEIPDWYPYQEIVNFASKDIETLCEEHGVDPAALRIMFAEGPDKMNNVRADARAHWSRSGGSALTFLHPMANISRTVSIGEGSWIRPRAVVDTHAQVKSGTVVNPGAYIGACSQIGSNNWIGANACIGEASIIGDRCVIGENSTIWPNTMLPDEVYVSPGAIISGNAFTEPGSVFFTGLNNLQPYLKSWELTG